MTTKQATNPPPKKNPANPRSWGNRKAVDDTRKMSKADLQAQLRAAVENTK